MALLDRTSQKSQDTELRLSQMEIWMNEVNALFRDWNDQDLLAGDLPEDFAVSYRSVGFILEIVHEKHEC